MTNQSIFHFNASAEVRVILRDGQPWFVAKDVCDILGLINTSRAVGTLDDDERSNFKLGRQGKTNIINESGLYALIFKSRKAQAKTFRKWVTNEVLPSIRQTGRYTAPVKTRYATARQRLPIKRQVDYIANIYFRKSDSAKHAIYTILREELKLDVFSHITPAQLPIAETILKVIEGYTKLYLESVQIFEEVYIKRGLRGEHPGGGIMLHIDEHTFTGFRKAMHGEQLQLMETR